jgi:hypothetical protein
VKIREVLKKFRPQSLQVGDGKRQEDNVDALATSGLTHDVADFGAGPSAPVNWVPSQQDERPRY